MPGLAEGKDWEDGSLATGVQTGSNTATIRRIQQCRGWGTMKPIGALRDQLNTVVDQLLDELTPEEAVQLGLPQLTRTDTMYVRLSQCEVR